MKKRCVAVIMGLILLSGVWNTVLAGEPYSRLENTVVLKIDNNIAYVDNKPMLIDPNSDKIKPIIKDGRTLLPVRFVANNLGAVVGWDDVNRRVTIEFNDQLIKFVPGNKVISINGKEVTSDVAPCILNDRTYVPVRIISELLNKNVFYDRKIVIISEKDNPFDQLKDKAIVDTFINKYMNRDTLDISQIAQNEKNVVIVYAYSENDELIASGSGFCIHEGLFVTDWHVVADAAYATIGVKGGEVYEVDGFASIDTVFDIAIMKMKEVPKGIEPLKLGSAYAMKKGEEIVTISSPFGLHNVVSEGIISNIEEDDGRIGYFYITATSDHGSSGGPVFNRYGEVIGVIMGGFEENSSLNYALSIDEVINKYKWYSEMSFDSITQMLDIELKLPETTEEKRMFYTLEKMIQGYNERNITKYIDAFANLNSTKVYDEKNIASIFKRLANIKMEDSGSEIILKGNKGMILSQLTLRSEGELVAELYKLFFLNKLNNDWKISGVDTLGVVVAEGYDGEVLMETGTGAETEELIIQRESDGIISNLPEEFGEVEDMVIASNVLYATVKKSNDLYAVDLVTKEVKTVSFKYHPRSLYINDHQVYVGLLSQDYSYNTNSERGAVAVVDTQTLTVSNQIDINIDPYDIIVDQVDNVYVLGGSNQWTSIKSFSLKSEMEIDEQSGVYMQSIMKMHPVFNRIYVLDTLSSPRDYRIFNTKEGTFKEGEYESSYHGDYLLEDDFEISPDGKYLFNPSGNIFSCGVRREDDLKYYGQITPYIDSAFNLEKDIMFTVVKGGIINMYEYSTMKPIKTFTLRGEAVKLVCEADQLIAVTDINSRLSTEIIALNEDSDYSSRENQFIDMIIDDLISSNDHLFNFEINDTVMHSSLPVVFMSDTEGKKVYRYNCVTKKLDVMTFEYKPESLYINDDKLYVALVKKKHEYSGGEDVGLIATIDAVAFKELKQFEISIDPADIVVDPTGEYIYVSGGSNQWTNIKSFGLNSGMEVSTSESIYQGAEIELNLATGKLYSVITSLSPKDYDAFGVNDGVFTGESYDSPYHGQHSINGIHITPDGKYIFSESGEIFNCDIDQEKDLTYSDQLNKEFYDIVFDSKKNRIFTAVEGGFIYTYDYNTLKGIASYKLKANGAHIYFMDDKLYVIEKVEDQNLRHEYTYQLEVIDVSE